LPTKSKSRETSSAQSPVNVSRTTAKGPGGEVVFYRSPDGLISLDVKLVQDTVWLTQRQMASLFQRERSVITKHINNVFKEGELTEKSNVQNLHIAGSDKPVRFFNLDVVISVGYRVKSKRATRFRRWCKAPCVAAVREVTHDH